MTWIQTESGNLINSDAVREFAIIGPYEITESGEEHPGTQRYDLYDLYAFGVGEVYTCHEKPHWCHKPFRDGNRYLVLHMGQEECEFVFGRLREAIRNGDPYFDAYETLDWHRKADRKVYP